MSAAQHPQQGLRACLGLVRLGDSFGQQRLESACKRALRYNTCTYKNVESILKTGLDRMIDADPAPVAPLVHDNLRGADYFEPTEEASHVN